MIQYKPGVKLYSIEQVITILLNNPDGLMLGKIKNLMGCSEVTARNYLNSMKKENMAISKNIGVSEVRPILIWSINLDHPRVKEFISGNSLEPQKEDTGNSLKPSIDQTPGNSLESQKEDTGNSLNTQELIP